MIVSDLFFSIYENFTIRDVSEKMKQLSKDELYLLLIVLTDNADLTGMFTIHNNLTPFKSELINIREVSQHSEISDKEAYDIINKYISGRVDGYTIVFEQIKNQNGDKLKPPPSEKEAVVIRRDLTINEIIN